MGPEPGARTLFRHLKNRRFAAALLGLPILGAGAVLAVWASGVSTAGVPRLPDPAPVVIPIAEAPALSPETATWPDQRTAGFAAFGQSDYAGAVASFEAALALAKDADAAPQDLGTILENLATAYFAAGRYESAQATVERWGKLLASAEDAAWAPEHRLIRGPLAGVIDEALDKTGRRASDKDPARTAPAPAPEKPSRAIPETAEIGEIGEIGVHLVSAGLESNVQPSWDHIKAAYPGHFADKSLVVKQVDLGDQGIFYRILAAPFANTAEAETLCQDLSAAGQYCAVRSLN